MGAIGSDLTISDTNSLKTEKDGTRRRRAGHAADSYSFFITWSNTVDSTKLATAKTQAAAFAASSQTFTVDFASVSGLDCSATGVTCSFTVHASKLAVTESTVTITVDIAT